MTLSTAEADGARQRTVVEYGEVKVRDSVPGPRGTEITVEDLFANTPARLKFLKSDATESSQIAEVVGKYAAAYPEVSLDVSVTDRMVNLVEEGFDVGVRIGVLADSSVIARKLAGVRMVTCASPDYLQAAGMPATPQDLAKHEAILDNNMRDPTVWLFGSQCEQYEIRVHGRLRFGGADACVAAARRGLGVTRTPAFAAAEDLRAGRLVPLMCAYESQLIHVHAVYPHARHLAAKVRAFVDFLAERYSGEPEWHQGWGEAALAV